MKQFLTLLMGIFAFMVAGDTISGFESGEFQAESGYHLRYRLYTPDLVSGQKYPLIIHFHGAGSWGDDNKTQLGQAARLVKKAYPAFVLAPKTVVPMKWVDLDWAKTDHRQPPEPSLSLRAVYELVLTIIRENSAVDSRRIYVNGQSMGGYGCWDFVMRYPELVAAAVPVCGGGDVRLADKIKDIPIWVFHGARDPVVKVENSRQLVEAIKKCGGTEIRYTEYSDVEHAAWAPAYEDPKLFQWLFSQENKNSTSENIK